MLTVRLDSTIQPIGIVGPSFFGISELPANISKEFDVSFSDSFSGRNRLINSNLVYNNIPGERATQLNQVYFNVTPNP